MAGRLYGVGVGPGDPELMTIKACKIIRSCPVIAVPGRAPEETVAYQIAPERNRPSEKKNFWGSIMPMTKDPKIFGREPQGCSGKAEGRAGCRKGCGISDTGRSYVYSTYLYVHQELREAGYQTEIVSGIPSFARRQQGADGNRGKGRADPHRAGSYQIQEALELPGTKILMKAGRQYGKMKEQLLSADMDVVMVENCGMEGERIFHGAEEMPEEAGYYTLIFVKDKGERV